MDCFVTLPGERPGRKGYSTFFTFSSKTSLKLSMIVQRIESLQLRYVHKALGHDTSACPTHDYGPGSETEAYHELNLIFL